MTTIIIHMVVLVAVIMAVNVVVMVVTASSKSNYGPFNIQTYIYAAKCPR